MNVFNDYILGEIGTGTREQNTTEYLNQRRSVFAGMSNNP